MAKNYPDTIPTGFANDAALADAYKLGWNHGHGIACHNVPTLGGSTGRYLARERFARKLRPQNLPAVTP